MHEYHIQDLITKAQYLGASGLVPLRHKQLS